MTGLRISSPPRWAGCMKICGRRVPLTMYGTVGTVDKRKDRALYTPDATISPVPGERGAEVLVRCLYT
ncbi:MAG: hypothetical protein P8186_22390 [Anaerolineae bacterium]